MAAMEENVQEPWDATKKEKVNRLANMMMDATSKDYIDQDLMGQIQSLTAEVQQFYPCMNPDKVQVQVLKEAEAEAEESEDDHITYCYEKDALLKWLKSTKREWSEIVDYRYSLEDCHKFTVHFTDGETAHYTVWEDEKADEIFEKKVTTAVDKNLWRMDADFLAKKMKYKLMQGDNEAERVKMIKALQTCGKDSNLALSMLVEIGSIFFDIEEDYGLELFATYDKEFNCVKLKCDEDNQYNIYRTKTPKEKISAKNISLLNFQNNENHEAESWEHTQKEPRADAALRLCAFPYIIDGLEQENKNLKAQIEMLKETTLETVAKYFLAKFKLDTGKSATERGLKRIHRVVQYFYHLFTMSPEYRANIGLENDEPATLPTDEDDPFHPEVEEYCFTITRNLFFDRDELRRMTTKMKRSLVFNDDEIVDY
tara:strand:- start:1717 stop:2997 length:1281 start_codon:yes stop_codon:yes gene_type:complete